MRVDVHRTADGRDLAIFVAPRGWWNVPGLAPGPRPAGGPVTGIHAAAPDGGLAGVIQSAAGSGATLPSLWRLLLIVVSVLGIVWSFTGCTVAQGNRNAGTYSYVSLAGNARFGEMGPEGMRNAEIDNSTGAGVVRDTAEKIGKAWAWGKAWDAAGKLVEEGFDALKDTNETDVRINAQNNAAEVATETFVPPAPVE